MIDFLSISDVLDLHQYAIDHYAGVPGVRDRNLLESAVAQPILFIFGEYIYPSIFHMASAYALYYQKSSIRRRQ